MELSTYSRPKTGRFRAWPLFSLPAAILLPLHAHLRRMQRAVRRGAAILAKHHARLHQNLFNYFGKNCSAAFLNATIKHRHKIKQPAQLAKIKIDRNLQSKTFQFGK